MPTHASLQSRHCAGRELRAARRRLLTSLNLHPQLLCRADQPHEIGNEVGRQRDLLDRRLKRVEPWPCPAEPLETRLAPARIVADPRSTIVEFVRRGPLVSLASHPHSEPQRAPDESGTQARRLRLRARMSRERPNRIRQASGPDPGAGRGRYLIPRLGVAGLHALMSARSSGSVCDHRPRQAEPAQSGPELVRAVSTGRG